MSYSFNDPCWSCQKNINKTCKDAQTIRDAVNLIHTRTYDQGHQGGGQLLLMCCRIATVEYMPKEEIEC